MFKPIRLLFILTILILLTTVFVPTINASGQFTNNDFAIDINLLEEVYQIDNVYSTYSPSSNFTINGGIYNDRDSLLVRPKTTTQVAAGVTLSIDQTIEVTNQSALVLDMLFYSNVARSIRIELILEDDSLIVMKNDEFAYTSKNNSVVQELTIANNAYTNNLNVSTAFDTKNPAMTYNQLVIPFESFDIAEGNSIELKAINIYAPAFSSATYNKYTITTIGLSDNFVNNGSFTTTELWNASTDTYTAYGAAEENLDIRIIHAGEILMEPSLNSSGTGLLQELVFKFPDALINESGFVETATIKGLTIEFTNQTAVNFNGFFRLYGTSGTTIANSNYTNLKTHKVTKNGTEADSNAKYFYPNTNTVGYADSFILYNFETTSEVTVNSTESFYSPDGNLPVEISPYFTFSYDNSNTFSLEGVYLGNIRIVTQDISVYENTTSRPDVVSISAKKGYLGNEVVFTAIENGFEVESVLLNGQALNESQISQLFNQGLKRVMTGNMHLEINFIDPDQKDISVLPSDHGTLVLGSAIASSNTKIRVLIKPDAGYELEWIKQNNVDVTSLVVNNALVTSIFDDTVFEAKFKEATQYTFEDGAWSSLYNSYPGTIWSTERAVNVQTTVGFAEEDPAQLVGVNLQNIDYAVLDTEYLVISLNNLINMWRTFQVRVNGVANISTGTYYLVNRYGDIVEKIGTGIITESTQPGKISNATLNIVNSEGFFGYVVIPMSSFSDIDVISTISIYTEVKDKSYARFNISDVYITDEFSIFNGPIIDDNNIIWTPTSNNFASYDVNSLYSEVRILEKGEISLQTVVANTAGYDSLYVTLPQNTIGTDGYVDLAALNIKGIAIDVKNYNQVQHSLAIRIAGSDNTNLTDTTKTLWQTSISNHPVNVIYNSGLVRMRNSAFVPYDDSGSFEGTIYITFNSLAFTNIGASGSFPTKIQPLFRLFPGSMNETSYSNYDFTITGMRLINDDSEFNTHQITMNQIGGTIAGNIDGNVVSNNANNNVIDGTAVYFTVTPNSGYALSLLTYTMGGSEQTNLTLDENNQFDLTITGDVLIIAIFDEVEYTITYELNGGVNHENNPDSYTIESSRIILEAPTKEGFIFAGWYANNQSISEISSGSQGNIVIEARWNEVGDPLNDVILYSAIGGSVLAVLGIGAFFIFKKKKVI